VSAAPGLGARLLQLSAGQGDRADAAWARETAELVRRVEELELRVHALDALDALLPERAPLRVGVRRYDQHVVAWIDTPGGAREGSGRTLSDALLSAASAGLIARRAANNPRHSGL